MMIAIDISLDETLRTVIDDNVRQYLQKTLVGTFGLCLDQMRMEGVDEKLKYVYYYLHVPSGVRYSHNFVTSMWAVVGASAETVFASLTGASAER
jgi:hypothetical protein